MEQKKRFRMLPLLLALLLLCTVCLTSSAEEEKSEFTIRGKTLVKYNGPGGEVTVPDGIEKIEEEAFQDSGVTRVILPDTVRELGHHCFYGCYGLKEITLPASVEKLEETIQVFGDNPALSAIGVSEDNPNYISVDGVLFTSDRKTLVYYPDGKNKNGSYEIPEGTTRLAQSAFCDPPLTSLTLPSTFINKGSLENSFIIHSLEEINVAPGNVKYYSRDGVLYSGDTLVCYPAAKKTKQLKPEDFPEGLKTIGSDSFWCNNYLQSIELPESLEGIGKMAFGLMDSLKTCRIPASVKYIGLYAFTSCKALERVTILNPDVEQPDLDAEDPKTYNLFYDTNEKAVLCSYPDGLLQQYAEQCGLHFEPLEATETTEETKTTGEAETIAETETTEEIPDTPSKYFVVSGTALMKYNGPDAVVKVPDFITELGEGAFEYSPVRKVILPEGLEEIRSYCFSDCAFLEEITLPASLKNLETDYRKNLIQAQVFARNPKLQAIRVAEGNKTYTSIDGVLFTADEKTLLYYPDGKNPGGRYEIPEGTEFIGFTAFTNPDITALYIPSTVREFQGQNDFVLISSLREVNVSPDNTSFFSDNGVLYDKYGTLLCYPNGKRAETLKQEDFHPDTKQIGPYAFEGDKHLKDIELPEGLTSLGYMSFRWAEALETVTVPASVNIIGSCAFAECRNLKRVTVLNPQAVIQVDHYDNETNTIFWDTSPTPVLCGYEGSTTQTYAETNNIPFESLGPIPEN